MKRICVQWKDSISMDRWQSRDVVQEFVDSENLLHESVGYLYALDDNALTLVQSTALYKDGNLSDVLKIPKEAIVQIHYLSLGKEVR